MPLANEPIVKVKVAKETDRNNSTVAVMASFLTPYCQYGRRRSANCCPGFRRARYQWCGSLVPRSLRLAVTVGHTQGGRQLHCPGGLNGSVRMGSPGFDAPDCDTNK